MPEEKPEQTEPKFTPLRIYAGVVTAILIHDFIVALRRNVQKHKSDAEMVTPQPYVPETLEEFVAMLQHTPTVYDCNN